MSLSVTYSLADQNFDQTKSLGIFNISIQLLEALSHHPDISNLTVFSNRTLKDCFKVHRKTRVAYRDLALRGRWGRILWDQWGVYKAARQVGNEWLFLPKGFASFLARPPVRLCAWVMDGMQDHYAKHYPKAVSRAEAIYFKQAFKATLRSSEIVFTLSDFTSSEVARIAKGLGIEPPAIKTLGVGFHPQSRRLAKANRILVLAGRYPHKRTDLALAYLNEWQRQSGFAGTIDWVGALPPGLALPSWQNWKHWPRLPEAEYRNLLAQSRALIYFSEYEGFGMPPVEAALVGACPVYSDIPVTREVMGGAGFPFKNESPDEFISALNRACKTSELQIFQWSAELLERHSWAKVTARFISALREKGIEERTGGLIK